MDRIRNSTSNRCLINNRVLILYLLIFFPAPWMAQAAPNAPARDENVQKFLNTPVWYLNYRITIKASGSGVADHGGRWSASFERVTNGTMKLGLRSQGPSLSMLGIATSLTTPEAMDNMFGNYVNWISGENIDESKSEAENEALLQKTVMENFKAFEHYKYDTYGEYPGVCGESSGPCGFESSHSYGEGNGEVTFGGNFAFEIDAEHKKFNLLFDVQTFHDSVQSSDALVGESISNEGTNLEQRTPIKMGLRIQGDEIESMVPPWDNGPMGANIVGNLPSAYGPIAGDSTHAIKVQHGGTTIPGTLSVQYVFSNKLSEPAELIITPPDDYAKWRPMGGKNETEAGDYIPVYVTLQKRGGGKPQFKAVRFTYKLKETSREKGVCMNSPKIPDPKNPFDLQFEKSENPGYDIIGQDRQSAVQSFDGDYMTEGQVVVSSFDYGAYGELEVMAELENGEVVYGKVKGTNEDRLKIPDRNPDSWIAKSFLTNLGNLPDTDDNEDKPEGDGFNGDGLSLYEEYRGFIDGGSWTAGDPKKKDIFIFNEMRGSAQVQRGINVFESVSDLVVHRHILTKQVSYDMVINFNFNPKTHIVDQHVIRIKAGRALARGAGAAFVEKVGTPGTAKSVNMPPDWEEFRNVGGRMIPSFERTLAHEMSHDVNVYHHGEEDVMENWFLDGNPPKLKSQTVFYDEASRQYFAVNNQINEIIVKREDGSVVSPQDAVGAGNVQKFLKIGVNHGQHSGDEPCLMRYWVAKVYRSNTEPNVRYLTPGEIRGTTWCTSAAGTGVNAPGHRPQSRFSTAATPGNGGPNGWVKDNRGNCKHQMRVNDLGPEPKR